MKNNNEQRVQQILWEALKLSGEARIAYLDTACGGDAELRREVESLLAAHEQAADFLGQNRPLPAANFQVERRGVLIGRYKLLEKIGEGGFGVVYMAEQVEPVRRKVALKIIKAGMDTKEVIARFEAERQALALMDHPGIANILDTGATDAGRPYFVMELVRGIPITDYCDQKNLPTVQRLRLFMKVCHAVQHAHQKGIIHRDLKPNNVLVTLHDGEPVPKVIDFGVAKALGQKLTEKTLFTGFQRMIGTPAYMSPEQAELSGLDVDTRSDIYSLGVLLYELLTGVTPFDKETLGKAPFDEMRRMIRETEPLKPSLRLNTLSQEALGTVAKKRQIEPIRLNRLVRGDLDWIVMKCLEKDRGRRYETANTLALDLEHYLGNEPVSAAGPSTFYRTGKFVRRHKAGLATATALVLLLLAGVVVSTWQAVRARRAERIAAEQQQKAEREAQRAEADERRAAAEAGKSQQVAQFLKDMLQGVGPSVAMGRDTTMLREVLDKTADRVGRDFQDQPEVEAELRTIIGWVLFDLGDDFAAETFHRTALALRRKLHRTAHPDTATSLHALGHTLWRQGKLAEAEASHREALDIRRKILGENHLHTARSLNDLALVVYSKGNLTEAEGLCREAISLRKKLLSEPHVDLAHSLNVLAMILSDEDKLQDSEALHREVLAMRRKLFGNRHPDVAWSLGALGTVLAREGSLAEAESLLYESLEMQQQLMGARHPDTRVPRYTLAKLLALQGRMAEAAKVSGAGAGLSDAAIFNRLARPLATCSHAPLRDAAAAVSFAERAVSATTRTNAEYLDTLGSAYAEAGRFDEAISVEKEAMLLIEDDAIKQDYGSRLKLYEAGTPCREPE